MRKAINIISVNEINSKSGRKFTGVKTSNSGDFSVFDDGIKTQLQQNVGKIVEVEVEVKGNYQNIKAVYQTLGDFKAVEIPVEQPYKEAKDIKTFSMYISYSKDLAVAGLIPVDSILTKAKEFMKATQEL